MKAIDWLSKGGYVWSSGTTGRKKKIFQSPYKLKHACLVANKAQNITPTSRILTVCKMDHAGGALAQTLPALSIGAHVCVDNFNAFAFAEQVKDYTHTHLTPGHIELLRMTKGYHEARYDGLWVTCGSDRVYWWMIEYFVKRGATFMANWGMSECGPIAVYSIFDNMEKVKDYKRRCPERGTIMGDTVTVDYKILPTSEMVVQGRTCVHAAPIHTGDKVLDQDGVLFYMGRR